MFQSHEYIVQKYTGDLKQLAGLQEMLHTASSIKTALEWVCQLSYHTLQPHSVYYVFSAWVTFEFSDVLSVFCLSSIRDTSSLSSFFKRQARSLTFSSYHAAFVLVLQLQTSFLQTIGCTATSASHRYILVPTLYAFMELCTPVESQLFFFCAWSWRYVEFKSMPSLSSSALRGLDKPFQIFIFTSRNNRKGNLSLCHTTGKLQTVR